MNLRRWITALAVLAVFTALASAQVIQPVPISCTVTAATTPSIRSEGQTEMVGDVLITCTGGPAPTAGNPVDRANITVNYGVPVTSLVAATPPAGGASEALLSIDEPNTVAAAGALAPGYGQNAALGLCNSAVNTTITTVALGAASACPAFADTSSGGFWVLSSTVALGPVALNVYQGVVGATAATANQVTFSGVPVLAPVASGVTRVYRVTNVRVNPGAAASVTATVTVASVTGSATALNLTNNTAIVASSAASLTSSIASMQAASLCNSSALAPVAGSGNFAANAALISFKENVANSFKTRNLALAAVAGDAEAGDALQGTTLGAVTGTFSILGTAYNDQASESGFYWSAGGLTGVASAGLANNGTRLKAVFANVPANVTIWVSTTNVVNYGTSVALTGAGAGDQETAAFAVLQTAAVGETGAYAAAAAGSCANGPAGCATGVPVFNVAIAKGGGEAVWEVTNHNPASPATLQFAIYVVYNTLTPPATGATATVQLGYAATSAAAGTPSAIIPRFAAPSAAAANFLNIVPCQTALLFPFVSTTINNASSHWETGVAIANTGGDPWNSEPVTPPNATCTLSFYGTAASGAVATVSFPNQTGPAIGPGQNWAFVASDPLNTCNTGGGCPAGPPNLNFAGYMFAVCNFQFAHGFAYVEDDNRFLSTSNAAMGYLALVVNNSSGVQRSAALTGEGLEN